MSLFDRRTLLILPFALSACGFTPVYAPGGTAANLRGKVVVQDPGARESFLLVQELETQLGRGAGPYGLAFELSIFEEGLGVTRTGDITRFNLVGEVNYALFELNSDQAIFTGSTSNFTGYSSTGDTVETLAAERDARARLMRTLASQITTELYAQVTLPAQ